MPCLIGPIKAAHENIELAKTLCKPGEHAIIMNIFTENAKSIINAFASFYHENKNNMKAKTNSEYIIHELRSHIPSTPLMD
jgi:hypothetical protein